MRKSLQLISDIYAHFLYRCTVPTGQHVLNLNCWDLFIGSEQLNKIPLPMFISAKTIIEMGFFRSENWNYTSVLANATLSMRASSQFSGVISIATSRTWSGTRGSAKGRASCSQWKASNHMTGPMLHSGSFSLV